jgi:gliding motility-associated-like protein
MESNSGIETVSESYSISPEQTQDFVITVSDNCNSPIDRDTFNVLVHDAPVVSFNVDKHLGCPPLEVNFIENSPEDNQSFIWTFTAPGEDGIISFEKNPTHIFNRAGTYDVKLIVESKYSCKSELIKYSYITVFPEPTASFISNPTVVSVIKPTIYFKNESQGADYYEWSFGDADSSHQVNPEHLYPNNVSDYMVNLVAVTRFGCTDSIQQKVRVVDEITFYAPTAFTPDGDGKNEVFLVKGNGIIEEGFNMIVYDRWGQEIFNSTDKKIPWDGKSSDGKFVKPGVYTWIVKYTDVYMVPHEKSGVVNVIR